MSRHHPTCTFCGKNDSKPSKEHVIPKWVSRLYPNTDWSVQNRLTNYTIKNKKYVHIIARHPCERCNNEWLEGIEREARPILIPLFEGKPSVLDLRAQAIVRTWFFTRAVMYDLHAAQQKALPGQGPRPRYFENSEHRQLMSSRAMHPAYQTFIGRYTGNQFFEIQEDHSGISIGHRNHLQPLGNPVRTYILTLLINKLVLQIMCVKMDNDLPMFIRDFRSFYINIESSPDVVNFPPPRDFDDAVLDKFIYRWSEAPPPPSGL